MKLDYETQKAIHEFVTAALESLNGFKTNEPSDFVFNEALATGTQADTRHENSPISAAQTGSSDAPPQASSVTTKANTDQHMQYLQTEFLGSDELWALSQVRYDAEHCSACPLCEKRTKSVFGEGVFNFAGKDEKKKRPQIMIIGEGPGHDEDVTGRPFVGRAGQLLDKMLAAIELSRQTNCYICNIVKCRPPNNRQPAPDEVNACLPFLRKQIEIIKPRALLLMGRTACHALLDTSEGINRLHGKFFEVSGIPALCTYHPSALLHDESLKRPAWEDLKLFRSRINDFG